MIKKIIKILVLYFLISYNNLVLSYIGKRIYFRTILNEKIFKENNLFISYNQTNGFLNYCVHKITEKGIKSNYIKNKFNYKGSNLINGHMIPKADNDNKFVNTMINIVPQLMDYNNGIWKRLEIFIRKNYRKCDIITAPSVNYFKFEIINGQKIYIPEGFYKIIILNNTIQDHYYIPHLKYIKDKDLKIYQSINLPFFLNIIE